MQGLFRSGARAAMSVKGRKLRKNALAITRLESECREAIVPALLHEVVPQGVHPLTMISRAFTGSFLFNDFGLTGCLCIC